MLACGHTQHVLRTQEQERLNERFLKERDRVWAPLLCGHCISHVYLLYTHTHMCIPISPH